MSVTSLLLGAGALGASVGIGSVALTPEGRETLAVLAKDAGAATSMALSRETQRGVHWRRCDDARAAGAAPIYAGEPGYRSALDADGDGIACEPYRGR